MKEIINSYIKFIRTFESFFKKEYGIKNDLWDEIGKLIPREGNIGGYKYNFHGRGCRIEFNKIICEYDSGFINQGIINFSVWKLFKFIETSPNLSNMSMSDVNSGILDLIEKKIVEKSVLDGIDTGTYNISRGYYSPDFHDKNN